MTVAHFLSPHLQHSNKVNHIVSRSRSKPIKYEDCPKHRETTYRATVPATPAQSKNTMARSLIGICSFGDKRGPRITHTSRACSTANIPHLHEKKQQKKKACQKKTSNREDETHTQMKKLDENKRKRKTGWRRDQRRRRQTTKKHYVGKKNCEQRFRYVETDSWLALNHGYITLQREVKPWFRYMCGCFVLYVFG